MSIGTIVAADDGSMIVADAMPAESANTAKETTVFISLS